MLAKAAFDAIEARQERFWALSHQIWANPEGPFREFKAQQWCADLLEEEGFSVERGIAGVPTAIKATFGSGYPVLGFLGEYDALPGLANEQVPHRAPIEGFAYGHGCGHNLIATAHLAACIGLKKQMEQQQLTGTIVFFGCPAEEVATGKVFMARGHAFDGVDACIAYHPDVLNEVSFGSQNAVNRMKFHYHGKAAHAAKDPWNGRCALDAVELCNIGVNFLREHIPDSARVHYIITEGGKAPNVITSEASALYMVRDRTRESVVEIYNRILKVAQGAAMMTETELTVEFLGGCYNTMNNHVLAQVCVDCFNEISQPEWTQEEIAFAGAMAQNDLATYEKNRKHAHMTQGYLFHGTVLEDRGHAQSSNDMGDVHHLLPGFRFHAVSWPLGNPAHSWQNAASSATTIADKGMIYGAKIMALWAVKLLQDPTIVARAKEEFIISMAESQYVCPLSETVPIP